ncbi:MAG: hypothetical protein AAFW88_01310 [Pseudomonadota bacterium]
MLIFEDEFEITSTWCRRQGRPCLEGLRCARSLMTAIRQSANALDDSFEIAGSGELTGCGFACPFAFTAKAGQARLDCGENGALGAATIMAGDRRTSTGSLNNDHSC